MSATRLLVLGAVRGFGRAHGYLVRTELLTWGADKWANVKWGSLYHALRQLAKDGLLRAIEVPDAAGRVDYEITEAGEAEFFQLLREALRRPELRQDLLTAGLVLLPALSRAEAIELLEERLHALETGRADVVEQTGALADPGHVRELFDLWVHNAFCGADWTRGLIERLAAGAHTMAGEDPAGFGVPGTWTPTQG